MSPQRRKSSIKLVRIFCSALTFGSYAMPLFRVNVERVEPEVITKARVTEECDWVRDILVVLGL